MNTIMNKPTLSIIAAIGENRELGKDNKLLWQIPEDMKRFRQLTSGHSIIMGRTTFESIGKPLPNRTNIIVTRDANYHAEGCIITHSLDEAIEVAKKHDEKEIFIIGGGQMYTQAIGIADKLYLTKVKGTFEADTYFPDYAVFKTIISSEKKQDNNYKYEFLELERG